ncbi:hypothetical protein [Rubrivirga sp.]|uniref:hypothetical protein n=1 Tax=Rubrivirga sp. TaxID=1885344 RepID=UPI003B52C502
MSRSRVWILALGLAVVALAGCDGSDPQAPPAFVSFDAPSTYVRTFGLEGDSYVDVDTFDVARVAGEQAVGGQRGLIEVTARSRRFGETERAWYRASDDALFEVAYACPLLATVPPARRGRVVPGTLLQPLALAFDDARVACTGEPILWDARRVVYRFPLDVDHAWQWSPAPFRLERRVTGRETVTVAAGTYRTWVIETVAYHDRAEPLPIEWTDYVDAEVGLVLRVMVVENEALSETGQPLGVTFRAVDRIERVGP